MVDASPIRPWTPGPSTPRASAGVVDLWRADLTMLGDRLEGLLCPEEIARADQIVSRHRRVLWIRSRGVLRMLLGSYLDCDPRTLRFALGPHGKPELHREAARKERNPRGEATDLRFNLSHSGNLALLAVSTGREVGVDIETAGDRPRDELALAARVLGEDQARRLGKLDAQERSREFLRAWVTHEAAVKCRGTGLGLALSRAGPPAAELWSALLDVVPRAAAAVAAERAPAELHLWEWRD